MRPPPASWHCGYDLICLLQVGEVLVVRDGAHRASLGVNDEGRSGRRVPRLHSHHAADLGLGAVEDGGPAGLIEVAKIHRPIIPQGTTANRWLLALHVHPYLPLHKSEYADTHGVTYFHGCYSVGDDTLWGVNRRHKGTAPSLAALQSIRAARPDGAPIYVILDNLSAHKGSKIRQWARRNKVELCFTPTNASWANPIEAHFGPLRQFTLANSSHPNHTVQTRELQRYLRWRNQNARHPSVLAAQRRERARVRSERGIRWGGRPLAAAA